MTKQYGREMPKDAQWKEFYDLIDGKKTGMLSTYREGVGPVGRSMAIARRSAPGHSLSRKQALEEIPGSRKEQRRANYRPRHQNPGLDLHQWNGGDGVERGSKN